MQVKYDPMCPLDPLVTYRPPDAGTNRSPHMRLEIGTHTHVSQKHFLIYIHLDLDKKLYIRTLIFHNYTYMTFYAYGVPIASFIN